MARLLSYIRREHGVYVLAPAVILALMWVEFREVFARGFLVTPDLFQNFAAVPTLDGINVYLSKWNPANLGNESAQPVGYAILAVLTRAGILGVALEATVVLALVFIANVAIWILAKGHVTEPLVSLLAPVLYLTGPNLFVLLFNASVDLYFYALLPWVAILTFRVCRSPTWRGGAALGVVIALNAAFEPFAIVFVLPFLLAVLAGTWVFSPPRPRFLRSVASVLFALLVAALLNAPYYIGNLGYLTSRGVAGASEANILVVQATYGWSTPTKIFSLVGSGLYPRYAAYYPAWAEALLLLVPLFAIVSLIRLRESRDKDLRMSLALLAVLSVAWILLTRSLLTLSLLATVPYLLVFNYPSIFYLLLGFTFCVLATLGIDDLAQEVRASASAGGHETGEGRKPLGLFRDGALSFAVLRNKHLWAIAAAILLVANLAPASFYLASGDFRVYDAPKAIGFPPQWSAVAPSSFEEIYQFLEAHGGDQTSRALILPYPMFAGSPNLPGFTINLFNQPHFVGATYTGPFFQVPSAQEYVTTVLDYLIANRTNLIGIPLGLASVKYVIVDKQLDFSGPPHWEWDSLVGAPGIFLSLLDGQRDLTRVYADSLIAVYQNNDYRPYMQSYPGLTVVRQGEPTVNLSRTIHTWPFDQLNWTLPAPSDRISDLSFRPDGYLVVGNGGAGNMSIQFMPNATWPGMIASSTGLDNDGFYISSFQTPVGDESYVLRYTATYSGPEPHQGGYVALNGYDANHTVLWQSPTCCTGSPAGAAMEFEFDPILYNPATAYVSVVVAFPYRFGNGILAQYEVSNASLNLVPRPPPSDMLAPLILPQLPATYAARADFVVLWRDLTPAVAAQVASYSGRTTFLCIDHCVSNGSTSWDQLYLAYDSLAFLGGEGLGVRSNDTTSGVRLDVSGPASAGLILGGGPFQTIYIRASGNGSLAPTLGALPLAPITVSSRVYQWYAWKLSAPSSDTAFNLSVSGSLHLDALLFSVESPTSNASGSDNGSLQYAAVSATEYQGTASNGTNLFFLGQGFSPGWSLQAGGQSIPSIPGLGWGNLFLLSKGFPTPSAVSFAVFFAPQRIHQALVGVQMATFAGIGVFLLYPLGRRWWGALRKRLRKEPGRSSG